jgi:hypothetical protein
VAWQIFRIFGLSKFARNCAERRAQSGADEGERGNRRNRNERSNQCIFYRCDTDSGLLELRERAH